MKFEVGKQYKFCTGKYINIIAEVETDKYFVGEDIAGELHPIGMSEENAENWVEISHEEWMSCFK